MKATTLLAALFAACIAWYLVASILIVNYLQRKQVRMNWLLVHLLIPSYVNRYRKLTRAETGQTGHLYFHWVTSINAALLFAILTILLAKGVLH